LLASAAFALADAPAGAGWSLRARLAWRVLAAAALRIALRVYGGQLELRLRVGYAVSSCFLIIQLRQAKMKSFLSLLLLGLISLVQALSSTGSRLLVILEEASDKTKYSSFFGDLECELGISFATES